MQDEAGLLRAKALEVSRPTSALALPLDLTVDPESTRRDFGDGAPLPTGSYPIENIDGCAKYGRHIDPTAAVTGYTVHTITNDTSTTAGSFWLVGPDDTPILRTSGTRGFITGPGPGAEPFGAFPDYAACVAAHCALAAESFSFAGGRLGIYRTPALTAPGALHPRAPSARPASG